MCAKAKPGHDNYTALAFWMFDEDLEADTLDAKRLRLFLLDWPGCVYAEGRGVGHCACNRLGGLRACVAGRAPLAG